MIKRLAALVFSLAFFCSEASAKFLINSYAIKVPPSVSFVTGVGDAAAKTTYTFSSVSTGTAGATRKTVVGVCGGDGSTDFSVSSLTVGGVSATQLIDVGENITTSLAICAIFIVDNPSGTTANIVATFSEGVNGAGIVVWAAYDLTSSAAAATNYGFQTSSAIIDLSTNVEAGDVIVAISSNDNETQTVSYSLITIRGSVLNAAPSGIQGADIVASTTGTPRAMSADWTGTADSNAALVVLR